MSLLPILQYPDKRLRNKAKPVDTVDASIRELLDNMLETMYEDRGVGLAATQVNVAKRVIVMDVSETRNKPICLVNPEYIKKKGEILSQEGCLSFPGIYNEVRRAQWVHIKALDRNGKSFEIQSDEFLALCIQHEIDHLEGILFVDHLSALKRRLALKKLEKLRRQTL